MQRFRDGFSTLPAAAAYGDLHDRDPSLACLAARTGGWLMSVELRACGVDFSFAPVLDLDCGVSAVIGGRAFHREPDVVTILARAFLSGMRDAGVSGVGKHFPGHGSVVHDSHDTLPVDRRPYEDIRLADLVPYQQLAAAELAGVMPAHVVFECVDSVPAGFSRRWIRDILRGELGFQGIVFSDDLDMAAAAAAGDHLDRANAALEAGCDMALVCNDWPAAVSVVDGLNPAPQPVCTTRMAKMRGRLGHVRAACLPRAVSGRCRQTLVSGDLTPSLAETRSEGPEMAAVPLASQARQAVPLASQARQAVPLASQARQAVPLASQARQQAGMRTRGRARSRTWPNVQ